MKSKSHILLLVLFVGFYFNSSAQVEKGFKMIGGQVSLSFTSSKGQFVDKKSWGYTFRPSYGYFFTDQFAIGCSSSLSYNNVSWYHEGELNTQGKFHWFGLAPFARYYIGDFLFTDFRIAGRWSVGKWTTLENRVLNEMDNEWSSSYSFDFGVGTNLFLNDYVAIESRLFHERIKNSLFYVPWIQFSCGIQVFLK